MADSTAIPPSTPGEQPPLATLWSQATTGSAARWFSLGLLIALTVLVGAVFSSLLLPFAIPLFLAAVTAIMAEEIFHYFLWRTADRRSLSAMLSTAAVVVVIVLPLSLAIVLTALELFSVANLNWNDWLHQAYQKLTGILTSNGYAVPDLDPATAQEGGREFLKTLSTRTLQMLSTTMGVLGWLVSLSLATFIYLIALYFFFLDGPELLRASEQLIPLPQEYQRRLAQRFSRVTRAVVLGTFLAAFAQALATAIACYLLGCGHFFVFLVAGTITALIPLTGTWLVWGPCAIWLCSQGHWTAGIGLAIFGVVVVSSLDNVVRTYVLQSQTQLHPLLALVSVLGGLQVMGLWGIFVGPILASCLHALLELLHEELALRSAEPTAATSA